MPGWGTIGTPPGEAPAPKYGGTVFGTLLLGMLAMAAGAATVLWIIAVVLVIAGVVGEAESDVIHTYLGQIHDAMHASEGKLADALRPLYIEYLLEHG